MLFKYAKPLARFTNGDAAFSSGFTWLALLLGILSSGFTWLALILGVLSNLLANPSSAVTLAKSTEHLRYYYYYYCYYSHGPCDDERCAD